MTTTTTKKTTTRTTTRTRKSPEETQTKIELQPNSFVHEIFQAVQQEKTKQKKIEILQRFNENHVKAVLIWNFDESVQSDLPPGEVPYQQNTVEATVDPKRGQPPHSTLRREWKNLYHFVKGGNDGMNKLRKETMFINILETLHPSEAEILILVKDKNLQSKYNITKELVSEAYPDIVWGNRA